ncbi:hypothetical protein COW36_03265 [bacterium (Candidatus Blackallbacteria) CG17_big_fil_post_rev_8_21_14_2_50_48_46]|uniref:Shikimate kinase n=1 Tax=bacterium (Candidatus Blackallbacteria) CG17_big_fil_post_rev_8_21_14_2_50_48_46 TaxID=2014261 RepID=A0A2M7G9L5_9BACT|nr:MAG: hypothetical protein COW64_05505 [bacterium (Candidatus Blackallbacteria) CG18_big_fil_WC_8_21_14_2_50_49_26]PIW18810.1 MAG: hypothetical protein COW36_03265 [bacterium (Candidatus Blackallbacteria) CG17_big_fil_post_rev_8_21_14_2_50_48_46]PIW49265.1 MAG: hypothetical protein COW20_06415 [bacterium (Candidatus Blackallbacteria) CG13_big_fil_rev_8_21_14_2_50_49_14]
MPAPEPSKILRLALIGLPGSGKSTLGQLLSRALALPLIDSDTCFEKESGRQIAEVFAQGEEPLFRAWERAWLSQLHALPACIISTGGGMPCQAQAMEALKAHCLTIWLQCPTDQIWERLKSLSHPMIRSRNRKAFEDLALQREPFYRQAHWHINAQSTPEELSKHILERLQAEFGSQF